MAKIKKIKVWFVYELVQEDPLIFFNPTYKSWVEDCTDKVHARQRVKELNATPKSLKRYGYNYRWDFKKE